MFSKDFNIDLDIINKKNIPILINVKEWKLLFDEVSNKKVEEYRDELSQLLQEQKTVDRELIRLKKDKKKNMMKILNLSDEVNNTNNSYAIELLDKCQQEIIDINTRIEELTIKSEVLPKEIRRLNTNLLKETIRYSYDKLNENEKKLSDVNKEIIEMRNRLKELIEHKNDYEERLNTTYRLLHGILGNKAMEKLDKSMIE
ncbi:hypothetical protein [Sporosalibacterium faouarense]|uniref:hypothetical protein n=1 Tax=Sporosalibacterium faouarense TaxID=516123 RepID=UPI00141CAA3D|nr:hypothetical protein [Sporosalibacterium faouarense]MTI48662.1 hypothetical protein [Bacillota bacterium]